MNNKRTALVFMILFSLADCSCDIRTKPYLKQQLKFSRLPGNCAGKSDKFGMNSNINGERYEFQECLDTDFDGNKLIVERKGDTVLVQFKRTNPDQALFDLVLDIDTYPKYKFLTIGENTFTIIPAGN